MQFPIHIKDIPKSKGEIIRIEITEFNGAQLLNLRVWYQTENGEYAPTKKGVTFQWSQMAELSEALKDAEELFIKDLGKSH
jgi:hypothetical protein